MSVRQQLIAIFSFWQDSVMSFQDRVPSYKIKVIPVLHCEQEVTDCSGIFVWSLPSWSKSTEDVVQSIYKGGDEFMTSASVDLALF